MLKRLISMIMSVVIASAMLPAATSAQTDSTIQCGMAVYNSVGREVPPGTALTAGDYQVTVKAQNIQNDSKGINVYLAVKTNGELASLNKGYIEVESSASVEKNAQKTFNVTIPEGQESNTEISVYYWDALMKPFSEKLVWGGNVNPVYTVYGRITATHHSDMAVEPGTVVFSVERSDNFEGNPITPDTSVAYRMKYDGDANDMLFVYAKAAVEVDENDVYTILSLTQADDNTVSFKTADVDSYSDNNLYVYTNGGTQKVKYSLSADAELYVNGVMIYMKDSDVLPNYIFNNATGTVKLIDSSQTGKYDRIMITYYDTKIVDTVSETDGIYTVTFVSENDSAEKVSINIDTDKEYSIKLADGTKVQPAELKKGDVLSIAHDMACAMEDSDFYDILVSRSRVTGTVHSINGTEYSIDMGTEIITLIAADNVMLYLDSEYILYQDVFGRVVYAVEIRHYNLCVLENVYTTNIDQYYVSIITTDGKKKQYEIRENDFKTYTDLCYDAGTKRPVADRVFNYSVSEETCMLRLSGGRPQEAIIANEVQYNAAGLKIGDIRISDDTTSILDFTEYDDGDVYSIGTENLEEDGLYSVMGFGEIVDGIYQLVIIMEYNSIDYKSNFSIFKGKSITTDSEGWERIRYTLCGTDGETSELLLDDEDMDVSYLSEGMPVMIQKNLRGYIKGVYPLFAAEAKLEDYGWLAASSREGIRNGSLTDVLNTENLERYLGSGVSTAVNKSQWHFGLVYDRSYFELVLAEKFDEMAYADCPEPEYITEVDKLSTFHITGDTQLLVYNYANRPGVRLVKENANNVFKGADYDAFVSGETKSGDIYDKSDKALFDWHADVLTANEGTTGGKTSFALIKTEGSKVVQAYIFTPEIKQ